MSNVARSHVINSINKAAALRKKNGIAPFYKRLVECFGRRIHIGFMFYHRFSQMLCSVCTYTTGVASLAWGLYLKLRIPL